ncbi:HinT-interacting membrane complex lipoprotein P60 [Mycoplasmopsis verecunda]|uniref:P60-like lipoprotein n=1 Tax=Mycoplasmopsis verecunda TaxID=171291 RepID=A0A1T4LTT5_9BACT|nr:hypothetical protein [Mycoplasmopsis verecunda]WPB54555.1 hypothetical protein SAM46_00075 [Mycoplasmopsis verecunda]SJZ58140.1 hypothetical protein SAMN02745154_00542 [Mycoplasmopsis verecunda]
MKFKFWNKALLIAPASLLPLAMTSCGVDRDTEAKKVQDKDFKSDNIATIIENDWLNSTLKALYGVEQSAELTTNETYKTDALNAYQSFIAYQNLKNNPFYKLEQLKKWASEGILSKSEQEIFGDFLSPQTVQNDQHSNYYKAEINQNEFNVLYANKETGVAYTVNKILLVNKYFQVSNLANLEKMDPSATSLYKTQFQLDQFNLINYVITNKTVQLWRYQTSNKNYIFSMANITVDKVQDYNDLILNSSIASDNPSPQLLINQNAPYEVTMGGYQGITSNPFPMSYTVDDLLNKTASDIAVGFYDSVNGKLVKVNENQELASPILVSKGGKDIDVAYMGQIIPVGKTITKKVTKDGKEVEEQSKILSFDETPFASNLSKLGILLAINDENLYKTAQKAFAALGYKVQVDDAIKSQVEGMVIIK